MVRLLFRAGFSFVVTVAIAAGMLMPSRLLADEAGTGGMEATPVTRDEVWRAVVEELRGGGLAESQLPRMEDIDLPVALPAAAGRKLRVRSACWDEGTQRTTFRLECGTPGRCLPFLAYVRGRYDDEGDGDADGRAGLCGPKLEARATDALRVPVKAPPQPMVRAGDRAMATFVAEGLRIAASVTCLERGREGEVIRVRGEDGQVFRARVSGPTRLEAVTQ